MADVRRAGHVSGSTDSAIYLAEIRAAQGRLTEALRAYEHALQLATQQGSPVPRGTADLYVGLSQIQLERGDLDAATQSLQKGQELGEHNGMQQHRYRRPLAMARIRQAQGDLDGALDLLDEAHRLYVNDYSPNVRPVPALKARVMIRQGRVGEALGWAREHGLAAADALSYVREFEHVTLARVLLASGSVREALAFLERLLRAAGEGGRTGSAIEILVLEALAHQLQGDTRAALVPLERALALAESEGYVRVFMDEGAPMVGLLQAAWKASISPAYVRRLLEGFGRAEVAVPARHVLMEPLSDRELDVLRLLGTDLDGPEIASELMVSLNTMRTHTKSIYTKLGVNSRRAAVRRAEELDLLAQRVR
jgi:LuxR family maltose regulon positive regulatory protein